MQERPASIGGVLGTALEASTNGRIKKQAFPPAPEEASRQAGVSPATHGGP